MTSNIKRIRAEIQLVPIDHVGLDYCRALLGKLHYIDPYFPPVSLSIYGSTPPKSWSVVWRRPSEFLEGNIDMFCGGIESSDILQGELGDCWLMCSLCSLASKPEFIRRIFLNPEYCEQNFYRLRLCKDGEWQNITVDDMIPCKESSNKPLFSRCNGNELWVIILEKAYAKFFGSYMALKGGMAQESFEDLTGCPAFTYHFDKIEEKIISGEFWSDLLSWVSAGHCLLAATSAEVNESEGIVASHYYTVIKAIECNGFKLLHLRNPWGSFEWKGAWSDESPEWTPRMINQLHPVFDKDDGAFWMSINDFLQNFQRIVLGKTNFVKELRVKTIVRVNALYGAFPEEYFVLTVRERCNVVIELHQEDERCVGVEEHRPYLDLGMALLMEGFGLINYAAISQQRRESQLEMDLVPGTYCIVPISGGNIFRREANVECTPLTTPNGEFHPIFQGTLRDIFRKHDAGMTQVMDCDAFLRFMGRIGIDYDDKRYYKIIQNKYTSIEAGLTLQGFYEMFYVALAQYGESTVRDWMTRLGYDDRLYSIESRAIVASFHATANGIEVKRMAMSEDFLLDTWGQIAVNRGECCTKLRSVSVYIVKHEEGVTVLLNNTEKNRIAEIDLSESKNVAFCIRDCPVVEIEVPTNAWVIAEHLACKKSETRFSYALSARLVS